MTLPKPTKAYIADNLDGRVSAMTAAVNLTDAAKRLGTTTGQLRAYGWSLAEGEDLTLALDQPETVFFRKVAGTGPWTTDRKGKS